MSSLIRSSTSLAAACLCTFGLATPARTAEPPRTTTPPKPSEIQERVEVRLVQVVVSVIDPKSDSHRSVPGLTLDQFEIRLDGRPLTAAERAKVFFDPICEEASAPPPRGPSGEEIFRPLIAVIDFNYLDAGGRERTARAIETLAETALEQRLLVKVYGLTRQVRALTESFTNDREEIRRAAEQVRETAFVRRATPPQRAGVTTGQEQESNEEGVSAKGQEVFRGADLGNQVLGAFQQLDTISSFREEIKYADIWGDSASSYDPGASLAALEGILRAHSYLRGRKIVVLFTSEAFRFARLDRVDMDTQGIKELAGQGFTIWTVDAAGVGREQSGASELLSSLAADTGGAAVRRTGELAAAFRGAAEQLSCYYLVSLPVGENSDATAEHNLLVRLDTEKYKTLWPLRVIAPAQVTVPGNASVLRGRRIAALLSPEDFPRPRVTATLGYPVSVADKAVFTARLRTPLGGLSWTPSPNGGVRARLLIDAVVERDTDRGVESVCEIGAEKNGAVEVHLPAAPRPGSREGFTVELPCAYHRDGLYTVRGVITDLEAEMSGGARATAIIRRGGAPKWTVYAARVEAASGQDFVWRPGGTAAQRDRERRAPRLASSSAPADQGDRLLLRYVLCGPERRQAAEGVSHVLLRRGEDGVLRTIQVFPPAALSLPAAPAEGPFCAPVSVSVPEFTLEPGHYVFVVRAGKASGEAAVDAQSQEQTDGSLSPPLAVASFTVSAGTP